ncbi:MAG: hypothetical protein ACT4NU_13355 [Chromatiales bacterium]
MADPKTVTTTHVTRPHMDLEGQDRGLQIAKRIDWRFLLPDPELRNVACVVSADEGLFQALSHFSESLFVIDPSNAKAHIKERGATFDLLVASAVDFCEIEELAALIKPDGYLYWEVDRGHWLKTLGRAAIRGRQGRKQGSRHATSAARVALGNPRDCAILLEQIGLTDVQVNWHRPDFSRCLEVVPLYETKALEHFFRGRQGSLKDELIATIGRFVINRGWLPHLVPCFSVIARKQ